MIVRGDMSIVALDKTTLNGPAAQRDAVLDALQRLGRRRLLNLSAADVRGPAEGLVSAEARAALKPLRASPVQRWATKCSRDRALKGRRSVFSRP
jgi:hypothetical protein